MSGPRPRSNARKEAYLALVDEHADEMYRYALGMTGRESVAEDLVQEVFGSAWISPLALVGPERGRRWLMRRLRRRCQTWLRTETLRPDEQEIQAAGVEASAIADPFRVAADRDLIQRGIALLEERYRQPFLMVYLEGRSCREVAREFGLPLSTVQDRLHEAREAMRRYFESVERGEPGSAAPAAERAADRAERRAAEE